MHSLISEYYHRNSEYPRYNSKNHTKFKKWEDKCMDFLVLFIGGNKIPMGENREKVYSRD